MPAKASTLLFAITGNCIVPVYPLPPQYIDIPTLSVCLTLANPFELDVNVMGGSTTPQYKHLDSDVYDIQEWTDPW